MNSASASLQRTGDELAFLPAALEIQETPPNPTGRALMWCVIALVVVAILWAAFGHIDIVAVAPGKIIPSDRVKVIQPLATGQVKAIHIRDGQAVRQGDVLIELDSTIAQADWDRLSKQLSDEQAALERNRAFAIWLQTGKVSASGVSSGLQRSRRAISLYRSTVNFLRAIATRPRSCKTANGTGPNRL